MPRTLVLAMPDTGWKSSRACDYVLSADGRSVTRHGQATLAMLPPADALVMLVPPNRLSWHRVRVPPVPPRRMAAALAGLLEDRLLDETAQVCFAMAPGAPVDGTRLVAVCDRDWLQALIDGCNERRLRLVRIAPAHPPATDEAGRCDVVRSGADGPLAVRIERDYVLAMPLEGAAVLWPALEGAAPRLLAQDEWRGQAESALGPVARRWSIDEALWLAAQSGWDLLQFDLAEARRRPGLRRLVRGIQGWWREPQWRVLRWGMGLLLAAQVAGLNAWAWKLDGELKARRDEARALLLQSFPGVRTVVDAPLQMERELALLRKTRGVAAADDADALLAAAAQVLPSGDGVQSLRYGGGALTLTGSRLEGVAWEQAQARLSAQGLRAERDGDRIVLRAGSRP